MDGGCPCTQAPFVVVFAPKHVVDPIVIISQPRTTPPRKHVLDHADYTAPTRQHELDHTDHTDQKKTALGAILIMKK